jgi:glycopeptide antibiotics resistance protein
MTTLKIYFMEIMFVCVPAIIVFLCFMPYRMKALSAMKLKSTRKREIGLILFIISIFGILALTLWPTYVWEESPGMWGNLRILIERPTWNFQLSLVPFTVFKDYAKDLFRSPVFFFTTLINFFGNLAIFIPLGLLSALLFRKATWRRSAIIGFGLSTFIELFQYFIVRNTAIDDIILNTAGAMCGYLVYLLIKKRFPKFAAGFLCQEIK